MSIQVHSGAFVAHKSDLLELIALEESLWKFMYERLQLFSFLWYLFVHCIDNKCLVQMHEVKLVTCLGHCLIWKTLLSIKDPYVNQYLNHFLSPFDRGL